MFSPLGHLSSEAAVQEVLRLLLDQCGVCHSRCRKDCLSLSTSVEHPNTPITSYLIPNPVMQGGCLSGARVEPLMIVSKVL